MGKMSRDKGKVGEREIATILKAAGFEDAKRGVQYKGGAGSPDVLGLPGVHIEVKRVEALQLWPAMEQAKAEAAPGEVPAVFHRKNNKPWVAIVALDDFLAMRRELETLRKAFDYKINPPVVVPRRDFDGMPDLTKINWNEEFERG